MRSKFPGYYKLADFDLLWKEAMFVLDTSVLLSLYRYPKMAKEQTIATLGKLKDRLWIPYHVALEFQRNRLGVIHKQNSEFEAVLQKIDVFYTNIKSLDELKERHSLINPTSFIESISEIISKFRDELGQLKGEQAQVNEHDVIRSEIDDLLGGRVGDEPTSEAVTAWQDSGKKRYSSKIPPGYMDADKDRDKDKDQATYSYGGIEYQKVYGDLIIWNQIIEHCKSNNIRKLIFVTDDNKEDWWEKVGGKTIGPRPELVEEICRLAGVTHFHMYRPGSFLENANKYIGAQIAEETIDQVRDISSAANSDEIFARLLQIVQNDPPVAGYRLSGMYGYGTNINPQHSGTIVFSPSISDHAFNVAHSAACAGFGRYLTGSSIVDRRLLFTIQLPVDMDPQGFVLSVVGHYTDIESIELDDRMLYRK